MPSTNLCWIHSAKYLCSQDAQATLSKPSIHPFQRQDGPPRPMEHGGGAQGRGKGGERRMCKERAAEVAREGDVRTSRLPDRTQPPTAHPSVPHAPLFSQPKLIASPRRAPRRAALSPRQVQREQNLNHVLNVKRLRDVGRAHPQPRREAGGAEAC